MRVRNLLLWIYALTIAILALVGFSVAIFASIAIPLWAMIPILGFAFLSFAAMIVTGIVRMNTGNQGSPIDAWTVLSDISVRGWLIGVLGAAIFALVLSKFGKHPIGHAQWRDGHAVLTSHGRVLVELNEDEFREARAAEACQGFGMAFLFSWAPFIFFRYSRPTANAVAELMMGLPKVPPAAR